MTIEEKARAYDEALEDMRVIYPNLRGDAKLAAEHAFPGLVEGEDDRIKKIITDSVFYLYGAGDEYKDTLDYLDKLEKRKECLADNGKSASEDERIRRQMIRYFTEMKEGGSAALPYDDCIAYLERRKETGVQWLKSDNVKNPDKPYIDKAGMFYTTDGRMCHVSEIENQKEQKHYWKPTETDVALFNKAVTTNNTLTPAERAQLDIIRSKFSCCRAVNCSGIVQKEQKPEEKLINWNELTWKDIVELEGIINNVHYEFRNGIGQESFGKEVLERFREYKGNEYLDEIEQKPVECIPDSIKFDEGFKTGREVGFREGIESVKPAEWSKPTINGEPIPTENQSVDIPLATWSEEDEKMINALVSYVEDPSCWNLKCPREKLVAFIKSLPKRFNLGPKQEWSKEDRDTLLMAATVLKANFDSDEKFEDCDYDCGTLAGKLLGMRYRISPSWRPSEEELRTLDIVISDYRHACTKGSDKKAEILKPLLEQLRKL